MINKIFFTPVLSFGLLLSACVSIPEKVPELITISSNQIENQSAYAAREWEKAISASRSAYQLLELIQPLLQGLDPSTLSDDEKRALNNFTIAIVTVKSQLKTNIDNAHLPNNHLQNITKITGAINLANEYVSKAVDENSRIEAVIKNISSLKTEIED
ncbi:hypothetical protein [Rheinheimera oceanensis]|uniref:hypothetical protein n=1 Tax=Rheinheimera oceanensis TaxID=2817449 RepID=UPI001BFEB57C|nr:hypothetical protein [Rheinheimera oceanensis]